MSLLAAVWPQFFNAELLPAAIAHVRQKVYWDYVLRNYSHIVVMIMPIL